MCDVMPTISEDSISARSSQLAAVVNANKANNDDNEDKANVDEADEEHAASAAMAAMAPNNVDAANFEQLMVSMLDERDKLVDSLKSEQDKGIDLEIKVKELTKERDSLQRQLNQNLPQVNNDPN